MVHPDDQIPCLLDMKFITWLKGKKTYFLAGALVVYVILGLILHQLDMAQAIALLYSSGVIASFRAALTKHQQQINDILTTVNQVNQTQQTLPPQ